jgi:hypothetical protein
MSMSIERSENTNGSSAQPETVVTLLRLLGMRNASAAQEADALHSWVRDNVPNRTLRISIRRNGYGFVLNQRFGRPPKTSIRPIGRAAS